MAKKLAVNAESRCMACLTCEIACSEAFYKKYDPALACIHIADKDGAAKVNLCVQCGKCAKECPQSAITKNEKTGVYMLNKKACDGCAKCVQVCPFGVVAYSEEAKKASKCIACGICVKACPVDALYIKES